MGTIGREAMHPKIPKNFPTWPQLVDALGNPPPRQLAKWLGLSERTIWNYTRAETAPRSVLLALFWLTPWGHSAVDTDRENYCRVLQSQTKSLGDCVAGLRTRIAYLEGIGGFASANEPVQAPETPPRITELQRAYRIG